MSVAVTVDLDWACEAAICELLDFLRDRRVPVTVFSTHRSRRVEAAMGEIEVGLHPHFGLDSSHGRSVEEVVRHVLELPHDAQAFRCHRFATSNEIVERLHERGLQFSSNVCTDMDAPAPFRSRFGFWEFPIFLEDGGYLYRRRALDFHESGVGSALAGPELRVLVLHPMHFAVNTPEFAYMRRLKDASSRSGWTELSRATLETMRHRGRGVRDFLVDLFDHVAGASVPMTTLGAAHALLTARASSSPPSSSIAERRRA